MNTTNQTKRVIGFYSVDDYGRFRDDTPKWVITVEKTDDYKADVQTARDWGVENFENAGDLKTGFYMPHYYEDEFEAEIKLQQKVTTLKLAQLNQIMENF